MSTPIHARTQRHGHLPTVDEAYSLNMYRSAVYEDTAVYPLHIVMAMPPEFRPEIIGTASHAQVMKAVELLGWGKEKV